MKTDLERCEINGWLRRPSLAKHTHTSIHRFELLAVAYSSCRAVVLPLPFRQYLVSGIWIAFSYGLAPLNRELLFAWCSFSGKSLRFRRGVGRRDRSRDH
jgi:hypothetical protein